MFNLPPITKNLLIINVLMFIASYVIEPALGIDFTQLLGLHFFMASDFHFYQFITYMFMHANITHILLNMFGLWMFGSVIERVWGAQKYLFYYMVCGIGAGLLQEMAQFADIYFTYQSQHPITLAQTFQVMSNDPTLNSLTTVGASGAIYALLLAFGMLFPEERLFVFPIPFPIKAKWFVIGFAAFELISAVSMSQSNVAHLAHLGGMLFGYILIKYWNRNSYYNFGNNTGQMFNKWKDKFTAKDNTSYQSNHSNTPYQKQDDNPDYDYNARKKAQQDEVDRILDKIRRSGYDSLTSEEKRTLFNHDK